MAVGNLSESWFHSLDSMLKALNQTLYRPNLCPDDRAKQKGEDETYAYLYILFVMVLFTMTVGSLILGYTRSRKELDKQTDPYRIYIKNRVSMI